MSRQPKLNPPPVPDTRSHWQATRGTRTSRPGDVRGEQAEFVHEERTYTLLTPLFGGGVSPKHADPLSVVRVAGIRGHLRFWWRATRGIGPLESMRQREAEIWGATATAEKGQPSQVQLYLLQASSGGEERPYKLKKTDMVPEPNFTDVITPHYAAFPLQPSTEDIRASRNPESLFAPVLKDVTFTLRVRYPSGLKAEVEAAFWAWETLGGIGARTRRGFGALRLDRLTRNGIQEKLEVQRPPSVSAQAFDAWMKDQLTRHVLPGSRHPQLPHLGAARRWRFLTPSEVKLEWPRVMGTLGSIQKEEKAYLDRIPPGAPTAWHVLIQKLRRFRQWRPKFPYENSEWPEADAIRSLTGQCFSTHAPQARGVRVLNVFPRAALGLPIVLHFMEGPDKTGKGKATGRGTGTDPADHSILGEERDGKKYERFASPVILRPVACADGGIAALAFVLSGPSSVPVPLMVRANVGEKVVGAGLRQNPTSAEAAGIPPLKRYGEDEKPQPSVVEAFLNHVKDERPARPSQGSGPAPFRKF